MEVISKQSQDSNNTFVVIGVSGVGKTLIAQCLAERLGGVYIEADSFHSAENLESMTQGRPLTDEMRWPWLRDLFEAVKGYGLGGREQDYIVACSALKRSHRDVIREFVPDVWFLFLTAPPDLIKARIASRKGHFMPAALLNSQLSALEVPGEDERHIAVDVSRTKDVVVEDIISSLKFCFGD